ncbi:MAG TPA: ABC transporter permease [candidate division Zixibacteria bacterium]|nr:ABC transporter permease [candidate division Zixibacteria bacterium]
MTAAFALFPGPWVWRVAARDARRGLKSVLLSMVGVVFGVAAVVGAFSFRDSLQRSVRAQSKILLGADLAIAGREPFSAEAEALVASLPGERSRQVSFASMAYFPRGGGSRLVQVRALAGGFPYYGKLETDPPEAAARFRDGPNALVDEALMHQMNAGVGDFVRIGDRQFRIAGKLIRIPGETPALSLISPRVYIPLAFLEETGLIRTGSLARYRVFLKLPDGMDADRLAHGLSGQLSALRLEADTVSRRLRRIEHATENLSRYLQLATFVAVLLAGVGVASGIHAYAREKRAAAATLRCIGALPEETVAVYLIQALAIAAAGSIAGAALGAALQALLPLALADFLPVAPAASFSLPGLVAGLLVGMAAAALFALLPLVGLRKVAPLAALRASCEPVKSPARDPVLWALGTILVVGILGFAAAAAGRWLHGLWFTAAILVVSALLTGLARGSALLARKITPAFFPFPWRQGLANLHRPDNQTAALTLAVGLGTFLLATLYGVRGMLLNQVLDRVGEGEPNLVLFDVQQDQRDGVAALLRSFGIRGSEEVPVVTMRLSAVKDRRVEELRADPKAPIPYWALRREYRSTFRSGLASTETLAAGRWYPSAPPDGGPVPVSLETGIAETLGVRIGDRLEFDVQGVRLAVRVASLREVDWQRLRPNFFVVFPEGVLESAPRFYAILTRADSREALARVQRALAERFPTVSIIDLGLVLETLSAILRKVAGAIRFIALFTIVTGAAVLAGAVLGSRAQRVREGILLRTLGAPRAQIVAAVAAEYLFLGVIAGGSGAALSVLATWGLSFYFLGTAAVISWSSLVLVLAAAAGTTLLAGIAGCAGIFRRSPLEALRAET